MEYLGLRVKYALCLVIVLLCASFLLMIAGLYLTFFCQPVLVRFDRDGGVVGGLKPEGMLLKIRGWMQETRFKGGNNMNVLFFGSLILFFIAMALQFATLTFKKEKLGKASWIAFMFALLALTAYLVVRGAVAKRLPLSNQFEFATAFAWGVALLLLILHVKMKADWLNVVVMPMVFFILSYAALQPREISDLMPALRSGWFGFHIGSAVISYSAFVIAGCVGLRYILVSKKGRDEDEMKLKQMDWLGYRLVALGVLMLTVTILSGAFWAEQAWGAFWTWDPKEVWALITWIIYVVYLHLRLRNKKQGLGMAWFLVISVPVVLFTFAGVNVLMSGLHSYA